MTNAKDTLVRAACNHACLNLTRADQRQPAAFLTSPYIRCTTLDKLSKVKDTAALCNCSQQQQGQGPTLVADCVLETMLCWGQGALGDSSCGLGSALVALLSVGATKKFRILLGSGTMLPCSSV